MFTGLVEALGTVSELTAAGPGRRLVIAGPIALELTLGESVAVNGACLTVIAQARESFAFEVGPETLLRTNLGELKPGDRVNLERSLRFSDRLGGHLVQGHIDGVGSIDQRLDQGEWVTMWFRCRGELAAQMVPKGSVAVDGISLTVVDVEAERFSVMLIPHTQSVTTLGFKGPGAAVNLETDLLAKYVWKYLQLRPS
ncbi:MAG: riboflavin synthase [Gemmataceae bacterium]